MGRLQTLWVFAVATPLLAVIGWRVFVGHSNTLNDLSIYDVAMWWDADSPYSILLRMNEVRVPYFLSHFPNFTVSVIDVGCGGGLVSEAVARAGFSVTGFDISEASLGVARGHAALTPGLDLHYRSGSIYSIPLPDASTDAVIVSDVLEHLSDIPLALSEIFRVLKPGGVFVFDTIARTPWSWLTTYFVAQEVIGMVQPGAHDWAMFVNPTELEALLTSAGFQTDRKTWAGIVAELSMVNAVAKGSKFDFIKSFHKDDSDMSSSYMGFAVKPV